LSVVVVATLIPKPGQEDAVREALLAAVPRVHAEPGCELYALHEEDGRFVFVEKWESAEALAVHSRGEALAEMGAALRGLTDGASEIHRLTPLPAGEPAKGGL
jgi:quinol monooxygenase YgiN